MSDRSAAVVGFIANLLPPRCKRIARVGDCKAVREQ